MSILIIIFAANHHLISTHEDAIEAYRNKLSGLVNESDGEALQMLMKEM